MGFGGEEFEATELNIGEWATGTITFCPGQGMGYGSAFVMPHDAVLQDVRVLFSALDFIDITPGAAVFPFVAVAVSNTPTLVYTVLQPSITTVDPFFGGVNYPEYTLRKASTSNLNIPVAAGTLVGLVAGIRAQNVPFEQSLEINVSAGLFFSS